MLFRDECTQRHDERDARGRPARPAYFRRRIGADEAEPLQLGSPFDFQKQMKLFVVRKMPDPRDDSLRRRARGMGRAICRGYRRARLCSLYQLPRRCSCSPRRWSRFSLGKK